MTIVTLDNDSNFFIIGNKAENPDALRVKWLTATLVRYAKYSSAIF